MANGGFDLPLALQALGAGIAGRGGQFAQQQQQSRLIESERQRQDAERQRLQQQQDRRQQAESRARAAQLGLRLLDKGDFQAFGDAIGIRRSALDEMGEDSRGTTRIEQLNELAKGGNKNAIAEMRRDLSNTINQSFIKGIIDLPKEEQARVLKASEVSPTGQVFELSASGQLVARDIPGFRITEGDRTPKELQGQVNTLRSSISAVTKSQKLTDEAESRINKAGRRATAAGDISLIFNFMKMNDPRSTVREGEFATAQNATGLTERARNLYNRARDGTRLGVAQRKDFIQQAKALGQAQREVTDNSIENILQQADQDQIKRSRVFGTERLNLFNKRVAGRNAETIEQAAPEVPRAPQAPTADTGISVEQFRQMTPAQRAEAIQRLQR